jgi:peptide/nickel transport system permease protein
MTIPVLPRRQTAGQRGAGFRLRRLSGTGRGTIIVCSLVVALIAVCAIAGASIAPHDPNTPNLLVGVQPPSRTYWLGTDDSGRDILSRLIAGARTSVIGPLCIALIAGLVGSSLGVLAGVRGGWTDSIIMRLADLLFSLPGILIVIVVAGISGGGYVKSVILLAILAVPADTRVIRGAALQERSKPYVDAARVLGMSAPQVMARQVWPNLLPFVVVNFFLNFSNGLVWLASLSFLGFGVQPGTPDWGAMLQENLGLLQTNIWSVAAPGAAIVITAVCMNLLGDAVYERIYQKGRGR